MRKTKRLKRFENTHKIETSQYMYSKTVNKEKRQSSGQLLILSIRSNRRQRITGILVRLLLLQDNRRHAHERDDMPPSWVCSSSWNNAACENKASPSSSLSPSSSSSSSSSPSCEVSDPWKRPQQPTYYYRKIRRTSTPPLGIWEVSGIIPNKEIEKVETPRRDLGCKL